MTNSPGSRSDLPRTEGIPVDGTRTAASGRHRDPTGSFPSPPPVAEQRRRLDRRRVTALSVAALAGTVIMVFGVVSLLAPDHQGWLGVAVGFAIVAVSTLVLVLDPPRAAFARRHLLRRSRPGWD